MGTEQVFKFPGFFDREIDLSQRVQSPVGTPAGVIGTAEKGPAFVPVTVGSFPDFRTKFGGLNAKRFGPYAVNEFLKHRTAVTYMRVLGAGANDTSADIQNTNTTGAVINAGFKVISQAGPAGASGSRNTGGVVFLTAQHSRRGGEALGFPVFSDNDSFGNGNMHLVRAMIMVASGSRILVTSSSQAVAASVGNSDDSTTVDAQGRFKLVLSSSAGASAFGTGDGFRGIRVLTASLNPSAGDYIAKILNTNPDRFNTEEHLLYADFPVEDEIATVAPSNIVSLASGSLGTSTSSGVTSQTFADAYGRFDTRFVTPSTTWFISQPYGTKEFNLFKFEALSDGVWANTRVKVSIANIKKSTNPTSLFGSFAVQVRAFDDTDLDPKVIEQFPDCNLDPSSDNYVAKVIGDAKAYYQFDADQEDERRIIVKGRFPNRSALIRIVMDAGVEQGLVPQTVLPFGFHGPAVVNTNDQLGDAGSILSSSLSSMGVASSKRLALFTTLNSGLSASIVPPLPFTYKATKGAVSNSPQFEGTPGVQETADGRVYFGVKTTRVSPTGSLTDAILNPNASSVTNDLVRSYAEFMGIAKMDTLVTGSAADQFNNNKFTLAKVALINPTVADVTGTANQHMRDAAYIRNAKLDPNNYTVTDRLTSQTRITLGTLVNLTSSVEFNRFLSYNKFTNILVGGFDGLNILDVDASRMDDMFASSDFGGGSNSAYLSPGLSYNANGVGQLSNGVRSYQAATRIMTDELTTDANILAIPGIRDSFVTSFAALRCKQNGLIFYVQDVVEYDEDLNRLFDGSTAKPDVKETTEQFGSLAVDNNYAAAYFPNVVIDDLDNNRKVMVPPSVAVLGALAFNDKVGFPWFAPAGFNRGGLDFVSNTDVRLGKDDRDLVSDARINPIVHFPRQGTTPIFVIFGQKTLQQAKSALDRVNVRRMLLEVKRIIVKITREGFVFEQNTKATRDKWISQVTPQLALVQVQAGIEAFKVTMDDSNNTQDDVENNKLNGRITIVPTRTVEFITIDFIITNAGVSFVE